MSENLTISSRLILSMQNIIKLRMYNMIMHHGFLWTLIPIITKAITKISVTVAFTLFHNGFFFTSTIMPWRRMLYFILLMIHTMVTVFAPLAHYYLTNVMFDWVPDISVVSASDTEFTWLWLLKSGTFLGTSRSQPWCLLSSPIYSSLDIPKNIYFWQHIRCSLLSL